MWVTKPGSLQLWSTRLEGSPSPRQLRRQQLPLQEEQQLRQLTLTNRPTILHGKSWRRGRRGVGTPGRARSLCFLSIQPQVSPQAFPQSFLTIMQPSQQVSPLTALFRFLNFLLCLSKMNLPLTVLEQNEATPDSVIVSPLNTFFGIANSRMQTSWMDILSGISKSQKFQKGYFLKFP